MVKDFIRTSIWDSINRIRRVYLDALEGGDLLGELALGGREGPRILLKKTISVTPEFSYPKNIKVIEDVTFFTFTSKMSCVSFSIPAGVPKILGSCPAAGLTEKKFRMVLSEAEKGGHYTDSERISRYGFRAPSGGSKMVTAGGILGMYICDACYAGKGRYWGVVQFAQLARKLWVDRALKRGNFVDEMSSAMKSILSRERMLLSKLASDHYFRIHDSGDFFSVPYMYGWFDVCERFPNVNFWAPTRVWVIPTFVEALKERPAPSNLALRPSQLVFGADAPLVHLGSLSAGTTASPYSMVSRNHFDCPAYTSLSGSCVEANCRVCWDAKMTPVSYWAH